MVDVMGTGQPEAIASMNWAECTRHRPQLPATGKIRYDKFYEVNTAHGCQIRHEQESLAAGTHDSRGGEGNSRRIVIQELIIITSTLK